MYSYDEIDYYKENEQECNLDNVTIIDLYPKIHFFLFIKDIIIINKLRQYLGIRGKFRGSNKTTKLKQNWSEFRNK